MSEVKVSIFCTAYNHERYIASALDGFINQNTNFAYEVLVHDDCSSDHTADIITKYAERYPKIVKPILQKKNLYSQGIDIFQTELLPRAQGEYIAICEGDDYWTTPSKLQSQVDAMDAHPEVDLSAHSYKIIDASTDNFITIRSHGNRSKNLKIGNVIMGEGGYVGTLTLMFRKSLFKKPTPAFLEHLAYDYTRQIYGALRGGILYLPECMAVYRYAVPNSYCERLKRDRFMQQDIMRKKKEMLIELDEYTDGVLHQYISARRLLYDVTETNDASSNIRILIRHIDGFRVLPSNQKIKVMIRSLAPWLLRYKHRFDKNK